MLKKKDVVYLAPDKAFSELDVDESLQYLRQPHSVQQEAPHSVERQERRTQPGEPTLAAHLTTLARLIANVTESYTAAIFLADVDKRTLTVAARHSLSRDLVEAPISFGAGLVGWTAENAVRISVCPFQNDATTLLYYSRDQDLKSFIAVPVIGRRGALLGVIACDSKKSYAYAKITEKMLLDCAEQAATLIDLHGTVGTTKRNNNPTVDEITPFLEKLREADDEKALLSSAAALPQEIIDREALIVITAPCDTAPKGAFYSANSESHLGHRLLDLVAQHKKVICGERSVHALPFDDIKQRSFLSIPFHVTNREAGSFNLLSRPQAAFNAGEISALEQIARVVGRELERVRLRERLLTHDQPEGLLNWKSFVTESEELFAEARTQRRPLTLLRFVLRDLQGLEDVAGIDGAHSAVQRLCRLVQQVKRQSAIASITYGPTILVLTDSNESEPTVGRLQRLIHRGELDESQGQLPLNRAVTEKVLSCLLVACVHFPRDGQTLEELAAKSGRLIEAQQEKEREGFGDVRIRA